MKRILVFCLVVTTLIAREGLCEGKLEVSISTSKESKSLDIPKGEKGRIDVHLASSGEMVDDYMIFLVRDVDRQALKRAISDTSGVVTFNRLDPGAYTVILAKTARQKRETTVTIGDIVLSLSGSGQEE